MTIPGISVSGTRPHSRLHLGIFQLGIAAHWCWKRVHFGLVTRVLGSTLTAKWIGPRGACPTFPQYRTTSFEAVAGTVATRSVSLSGVNYTASSIV
jgi:hypothetical protein